jgi:hypothetical protein
MKDLGAVVNSKDITTKEYVDSQIPVIITTQITVTATANQTVSMTVPVILDYKSADIVVLLQNGSNYQRALLGLDYSYQITSTTNISITFYNAGTYIVNYTSASQTSAIQVITSSTSPSLNTGDYWFQIL